MTQLSFEDAVRAVDEMNSEHIATCFYCGAPIAKNRGERDHFPIPERHGGSVTVWACVICHDAKDRLDLMDLPFQALEEFLQLGRWGRILFGRALSLGLDLQQRGALAHLGLHPEMPAGG